jgi:hypothetical protein
MFVKRSVIQYSNTPTLHLMVRVVEEANDLIEHNIKAYKALDFPAATGNTNKPPEALPK